MAWGRRLANKDLVIALMDEWFKNDKPAHKPWCTCKECEDRRKECKRLFEARIPDQDEL